MAVTIHVVDVNDNKPTLDDFRIMFNNSKDHFPVGPIGRGPAADAGKMDQASQSRDLLVYIYLVGCLSRLYMFLMPN